MDGFTIRLFREEVELQCRFVVTAYERLQQAHDSLAEKAEANRDQWEQVGRGFMRQFNMEAWFALQNLLVSGANISKLLWGSRGRKPLSGKTSETYSASTTRHRFTRPTCETTSNTSMSG